MTVHTRIVSRERQLEDAIRGMCNLVTKMQLRAARYLPKGDPQEFIGDILELLDGPEQRLAQGRARTVLSEDRRQVSLWPTRTS